MYPFTVDEFNHFSDVNNYCFLSAKKNQVYWIIKQQCNRISTLVSISSDNTVDVHVNKIYNIDFLFLSIALQIERCFALS